jgi:hypothetical protein
MNGNCSNCCRLGCAVRHLALLLTLVAVEQVFSITIHSCKQTEDFEGNSSNLAEPAGTNEHVHGLSRSSSLKRNANDAIDVELVV